MKSGELFPLFLFLAILCAIGLVFWRPEKFPTTHSEENIRRICREEIERTVDQ